MNFRWLLQDHDKSEAFRVRKDVFIAEQGVPPELEQDQADHEALHILACTEEGQAVGTARLTESARGSRVAKISRVAVRRVHRRRGLASRMMALLEHRAKLLGYTEVELDAQVTALAFYRKLGYHETGSLFEDAGMPHQKMTKVLQRRAVIAVGGNAVVAGFQSILETSKKIVSLLEEGWEVVLTHGNGPQVGAALMRSEIAKDQVPPHDLDVCVAETQGTLGYDFCRALNTALRDLGREESAVALITQTQVDPSDPAFGHPTKPIGPFLSKEQAEERQRSQGWKIIEDAGRGWRRVVPSPLPLRIVQAPVIRNLLDAGYLTVACGGGGIPSDLAGNGLAAVIDKDRTAALLAREVEADVLVICTAVPYAYLNFGTEQEERLEQVSLDCMRSYLLESHFQAGSMKPKVRACVDFVSATTKTAIITDLESLEEAIHLRTGTIIEPYLD